MWMSKCQKYRQDLALLVGQDLDVVAQLEAERHVATCPQCREHLQSLRSGQRVLQQARTQQPSPVAEESSVWSGVSRQMRALDERSGRSNWRGWLPAVALAAACLTVTVITTDMLDSSRNLDGLAEQSLPRAQGFVAPNRNVSNPSSNAQPMLVPLPGSDLLNGQVPEESNWIPRRGDRPQRFLDGSFRSL
jgi:anti-sigma factor RsiW